jgi:hypothetical protein
VGKEVEVQSDNDFVRIYFKGKLIALHPRLLLPTSSRPTLKTALRNA